MKLRHFIKKYFSRALRLFFPWMGRKEWLFLRATNKHYDYEKDYIDSGTDVHDDGELLSAVIDANPQFYKLYKAVA